MAFARRFPKPVPTTYANTYSYDALARRSAKLKRIADSERECADNELAHNIMTVMEFCDISQSYVSKTQSLTRAKADRREYKSMGNRKDSRPLHVVSKEQSLINEMRHRLSQRRRDKVEQLVVKQIVASGEFLAALDRMGKEPVVEDF